MDTVNQDYFSQLEKMASEICLRENCRLYDLEWGGSSRGRILRVFIDKAEQPEGTEGLDGARVSASLDDCTNVSNGLSLRLDVENIIPGGGYHLEVSTPGMDRALKKPWHYETAIGLKIRVYLKEPIGHFLGEEALAQAPANWQKKKHFDARLESVSESQFVVVLDESTLELPFEGVDKASVVIEFDENPPARTKKNKKTSKKKKKR